MKRPYIVYSLSKDRTTQRFNKNKFDQIIDDISSFLRSCTTSDINGPDTLELTAYTAYDKNDPAEFLNEIIKKTTQQFGTGNKSPIAFHYPSGQPDSTNKYVWVLPNEKLQEAIKYIVDSSPMPKSNFGPLELYLNYSFKFVDPYLTQELPNQEHTSFLGIWFSRGKSCSPTLFFPFEAVDEHFWNYIDKISNFLPFEFEEKYLRIAIVNKQGEIKSFKKINRLHS